MSEASPTNDAPAAAEKATAGCCGRTEGCRRLRRLNVILIIAGYGYLAVAVLVRDEPAWSGTLHMPLWYAAFFARTFLFHVGVVLAVVGIAALALRQFRAFLLALPLLAVTLAPALHGYGPRAGPADGAADFRVMSVNLWYENEDTVPIIAEIQAADPDVLLLQEYDGVWHAAIAAAFSDAYAHAVIDPQEGPVGSAVYSKLPLAAFSNDAEDLGPGMLSALRVVVQCQDHDIVFYNVHIVPPKPVSVADLPVAVAALHARLSSETGPIVITGDFNFTGNSAMHRAMGELGLSDAHDVAGTGRGATWPVDGVLRFVPGVRIDHVYLGNGLTARSCRVGRGQGSDHRPIVVDVVLDDSRKATR